MKRKPKNPGDGGKVRDMQPRDMRDEILKLMASAPEFEGDHFSQAINIETLGQKAGLSTRDCYILLARGAARGIGPGPIRKTPEVDFVLDLPEGPQYEQTVRALMQHSQELYRLVQKDIKYRIKHSIPLPDWLALIRDEIATGIRREPKGKGGRPKGAGSSREALAQFRIALLVTIVAGAMKHAGRPVVVYSSTKRTDTESVCAIVAEALREEGLLRSAEQVDSAYRRFPIRLND